MSFLGIAIADRPPGLAVAAAKVEQLLDRVLTPMSGPVQIDVMIRDGLERN
jgi:hypothetical protein